MAFDGSKKILAAQSCKVFRAGGLEECLPTQADALFLTWGSKIRVVRQFEIWRSTSPSFEAICLSKTHTPRKLLPLAFFM